ncbi:MAG: hypothetical protein B7X09_00860 [Acidiphilium sp. 21-66-27]|nr:MAG: hypothetical protein B7X09_00860 [Acidiphilium sp. 21-66-27]
MLWRREDEIIWLGKDFKQVFDFHKLDLDEPSSSRVMTKEAHIMWRQSNQGALQLEGQALYATWAATMARILEEILSVDPNSHLTLLHNRLIAKDG